MSQASFWPPRHVVNSAWLEHAPFAFWLTEILQPSILVELGTHTGFSYLAFCQAVRQLQLPTCCFAIDTWKGDDHAGHYGEEVFAALTATNEQNYATFSHLIRGLFDDALPQFGDGTIDLLHIDGRHGYADVSHDFQTWRPKLSNRAVVLFHDIDGHESDFGVWRVWQELAPQYPNFAFDHGHGLGILAVGHDIPAGLRGLLDANAEATAAIRAAYARLGAVVSAQHRSDVAAASVANSDVEIARPRAAHDPAIAPSAIPQHEDATTATAAATIAELTRRNMEAGRTMLAEAERIRQDAATASATAAATVAEQARLHGQAMRAVAAETQQKVAAANAILADADRIRDQAAAAATALAATIAEQARVTGTSGIDALKAELAASRSERDALRYSTMWRATRPLRRIGEAMPSSARRTARRAARAGYWLLTMQFGRRLAEWRGMPATADLPSPNAPSPAPVQRAASEYDRWVRNHDTLTEEDRAQIRACIDRLAYRPLISVVMPAYETPERLLREAIGSVRAQLYPNWELCIADDASPSDTVASVSRELAAEDSRIKWIKRDQNGHIAAATNSALAVASGEFVAFLDHDDLLAEHALYEIAAELNAHPETDLIYSDEDQVDPSGHRYQPYFKPDWNIDLLLGQNVFCHLGVFRRELLTRIGGLREGVVDGSQDHDLVLRCAAASEQPRVRHIPEILYHWRQMNAASSFSQVNLDSCVAAARQGVQDYLKARGVQGAEVVPASMVPRWNRVCWPLPLPPPRVSVIVPTRDQADLLSKCASGLLHRTSYPDLELLIVDNDSREPQTAALFERLLRDDRVRILQSPGKFNYSFVNNSAVHEASGEIVALINSDIDVINDSWLREMVSIAVRPDVGAVGAKLLYADDRIQHAGVVLGVGSYANGPGVAGHFGTQVSRNEIGYFGQLALTREVSAVTGACLVMRKEVYEAVGGLDAEHLPVSFNDVDLCLRIRALGLRVIWTPFAELYHLESASRGYDRTSEQIARANKEAEYMRHRWGPALDNDPFYNPAFDRVDHMFRLAMPPRREKRWRQQPV
ncbi:glycosyltransferase [Rhodopila sp.]|uniref:glycosyltransferase n=1 Tax=Rhodopila sp. TaxID=2480087 RepID=UPI003D13FBCD